jgi:hypothetical protein
MVVVRRCLNKCALVDQVGEGALVHNSTGPTATQIFSFFGGAEKMWSAGRARLVDPARRVRDVGAVTLPAALIC